jgi:hypothetical protein
MNNNQRCPLCHARTDMVVGIRLPRLKADILRTIRSAGDVGVDNAELLNAAYSGRTRPQPTAIKSHVNQLNDLLAETDFRIISIDRRWVLARRRVS